MRRHLQLTVTEDELHLLVDSLDSHAYWQLSDPRYRRDGDVTPPGSDDDTVATEIRVAEAVRDRLQRLLLERAE